MTGNLAPLIEAVEREQEALVALVRANLDAEVEEHADAMIARHTALVPAMDRLGQATHRLVLACAAEAVPNDLAVKIETWRQEITGLLEGLSELSQDFAARRDLITEALARLGHASRAMAGYHHSRRPPAKFVQKKA